MFAFTTQHVVIEFPERSSDCPEPKNFQKKFPQKNTSQYPWLGEGIRDWPCLKYLTVSWWIGRARFFDAGEICELRLHTVTCLASLYVGKQHQTNNEPQNRIKWPWIEPGYTEEATTGPSLRKYNFFSIFMPIFLRFNNYNEFLIQSL